MPQATFYFPKGFLWGSATAAYQVEGSNKNCTWSAWEEDPDHILDASRSGLACDWWSGRWREDLDRAANNGQNAHRFSIEWSRLQPTPDTWSEDALDFYRAIARGCHERGLTPIATLHHFGDPIWLAEQGGWENDETPQLFAGYVRKVVEALQPFVDLWVTINEPMLYVYNGYIDGVFPPGRKDLNTGLAVLVNLVRGHALAYKTIHLIQRNGKAGIAHHYRSFRPAHTWLPLDGILANMFHNLLNNTFAQAATTGKLKILTKQVRIPEAAGTQDYIGLNYYTSDLVAFNPLAPAQFFARRYYPKDADLSDTGFIANYPAGMDEAIHWAASFRLPIYITENGIEDADDHLRPQYIIEHIHRIWRKVNNNIPVRGYFHWTLVDNFEWERGWTQRFGLWGLDVDTQTRIRRPSADLYQMICRENGLSSEMVEKFAPQVFEKIFPG